MNRLRAFRDIEGLNQADLADLVGLSVPMVSAIESGRRPFNGDLTAIGYDPRRLTLPDMSEPIHRARASTAVAAKKRAKSFSVSPVKCLENCSMSHRTPPVCCYNEFPVHRISTKSTN